ncbi:MAG: hypothetical protein ACTS7D_01715 [Candidatus Hodgkinia cicadicola]
MLEGVESQFGAKAPSNSLWPPKWNESRVMMLFSLGGARRRLNRAFGLNVEVRSHGENPIAHEMHVTFGRNGEGFRGWRVQVHFSFEPVEMICDNEVCTLAQTSFRSKCANGWKFRNAKLIVR